MNKTKTLGHQKIKSESSLELILYENTSLAKSFETTSYFRPQVTEEISTDSVAIFSKLFKNIDNNYALKRFFLWSISPIKAQID